MKPKLQAALRECTLHAEILAHARNEIEAALPFDTDSIKQLSNEQRRILHQLAYRFGKLQDSQVGWAKRLFVLPTIGVPKRWATKRCCPPYMAATTGTAASDSFRLDLESLA